jgi:hypothetical protein
MVLSECVWHRGIIEERRHVTLFLLSSCDYSFDLHVIGI